MNNEQDFIISILLRLENKLDSIAESNAVLENRMGKAEDEIKILQKYSQEEKHSHISAKVLISVLIGMSTLIGSIITVIKLFF